MNKTDVLERSRRPLYESNSFISKKMDDKSNCVLRIFEANLRKVNDEYISDISNYDIQYILSNEGFENVTFDEINEIVKKFEDLSILKREFIELDSNDDDSYYFITDENGIDRLKLKRKRVITLSKRFFSKLKGDKMILISDEEKSKQILSWKGLFENIQYNIELNLKDDSQFIKIPVDVLRDRNIDSKAFRIFCAALFIKLTLPPYYSQRKAIGEIMGMNISEVLRLLKNLEKSKFIILHKSSA